MPCRSDYLEPTRAEEESRLLCKLLVYVHQDCQGMKVAESLTNGAKSMYGMEGKTDKKDIDFLTKTLCDTLKNATQEQLDEWVYDGKNPKARMLAEWWGKHKEWDKKCEIQEAKEKQTEELKKSALSKLTQEEIEALGL
jgi:hypothetical protein